MLIDSVELGPAYGKEVKSATRMIPIIPNAARHARKGLIHQIDAPTARIERLDRDILACVKENEVARRLTTIPGVGSLIRATVGVAVQDAPHFKSGRD